MLWVPCILPTCQARVSFEIFRCNSICISFSSNSARLYCSNHSSSSETVRNHQKRKNFGLPCTLEIHNSAIIQEISWDVKNSHELLLNYRYQVHDYHQTGWKYALTGPSQLTCVELFCKAPEPIYLFQKKHLNYIKNTSTAS